MSSLLAPRLHSPAARIKALLILAKPQDQKVITGVLNSQNISVTIASTYFSGMEKYYSVRPSILIIDIGHSETQALDMIKHVFHLNPAVPVIGLGQQADSSLLLTILRMGVRDFFVNPINDLGRFANSIHRCIRNYQNYEKEKSYHHRLASEVHAKSVSLTHQLQERRRLELALSRAEQKFNSLINNADDIIITLSPKGEILSLNRAFEKLTQWSRDSWLDKEFINIVPAHARDEITLELQAAFVQNESSTKECQIQKQTGEFLSCELIASALIERHQPVGVLAIIRDITERKQAEREKQQLQMQLLQSQKLESIGRLAGGVAHDFNNALTAILGFSDLALSDLPRGSEVRQYIEVVKDAGEKAAMLTKQLLAFSRKQILQMEYLCLNNIVFHMGRMLRRLIGDDVVLEIENNAKESLVKGDKAQLEQVIMNLVLNARDAMPGGGKLSITTWNEFRSNLSDDKPEQHYVVLSVTDTGEGMSKEVQAKIFEPFYTTKAPGKGTGLGLATVFGTIRQHSGFVTSSSLPSHGSRFDIYLPRMSPRLEQQSLEPECGFVAGGDETIFIVDDEPAIRRLLVKILEKKGYQTLQAGSGEEALELVATGQIDLLLTDMIMPGMTGLELSQKMNSMGCSCKVIFMSGYAQSALTESMTELIKPHFVQKPINPSNVLGKIREILDE